MRRWSMPADAVALVHRARACAPPRRLPGRVARVRPHGTKQRLPCWIREFYRCTTRWPVHHAAPRGHRWRVSSRRRAGAGKHKLSMRLYDLLARQRDRHLAHNRAAGLAKHHRLGDNGVSDQLWAGWLPGVLVDALAELRRLDHRRSAGEALLPASLTPCANARSI